MLQNQRPVDGRGREVNIHRTDPAVPLHNRVALRIGGAELPVKANVIHRRGTRPNPHRQGRASPSFLFSIYFQGVLTSCCLSVFLCFRQAIYSTLPMPIPVVVRCVSKRSRAMPTNQSVLQS